MNDYTGPVSKENQENYQNLMALFDRLPTETVDVVKAKAALNSIFDECKSLHQKAVGLTDAVTYARRFLKKEDHDTDFVDELIKTCSVKEFQP